MINNWDNDSDHLKDIKQRKFSEDIQMKKKSFEKLRQEDIALII